MKDKEKRICNRVLIRSEILLEKKLRIALPEDFKLKNGARKVGMEFWYWNGHDVSGPHIFNLYTDAYQIKYWLETERVFVNEKNETNE